MSLMHLLVAARSLKTVKDEPSPYKMKQANLLPKFVARKAEREQERQSLGPEAVVSAPARMPAVPARTVTAPAGMPAVQAGVPRLPARMPAVPVRAADGTERVKSEQRVLRGWKALRNKFLRSAPGKRIPVQTELLLDGVRVVRNDFQEANETSHPMVQSLNIARPRSPGREPWPGSGGCECRCGGLRSGGSRAEVSSGQQSVIGGQ